MQSHIWLKYTVVSYDDSGQGPGIDLCDAPTNSTIDACADGALSCELMVYIDIYN